MLTRRCTQQLDKKEILPSATTQLDLEGLKLNGIGQRQTPLRGIYKPLRRHREQVSGQQKPGGWREELEESGHKYKPPAAASVIPGTIAYDALCSV